MMKERITLAESHCSNHTHLVERGGRFHGPAAALRGAAVARHGHDYGLDLGPGLAIGALQPGPAVAGGAAGGPGAGRAAGRAEPIDLPGAGAIRPGHFLTGRRLAILAAADHGLSAGAGG